MIRDPGFAQNPVARLIDPRLRDPGFSQPQHQPSSNGVNPQMIAALLQFLQGQQHGVQPGGFLGGPVAHPAGGIPNGAYAGTGNHMSHAWGGFGQQQPASPWGIGGLVKPTGPKRGILPTRPQVPAYGQPFNPYGGGSNGGGGMHQFAPVNGRQPY